MPDVFAGGPAKIKDRTADNAPRSARRSFEPKHRPPTSTPGPSDEDEEESQIVTTKFKVRGGSGANFSSRNTASGAAAEGEGASSGPAKQPGASLFGRGSRTGTKQQRTTSPPLPTPTSSGEQMPPPPIASQLRLPSTHLDTPRRSTSRSSSGSSKTMYSDGEGGRGSEAGRGVAMGREQRGGQASSTEQQQKAATRGFKVGDEARKDVQPSAQDRQLHGDQSNREHAETGSKSSEEDEEETPLCITEDRPTPSPMGANGEQDEELVMSGGGGTGYGGDGVEDSEEESSSEEEDEVVLAGEESGKRRVKREREYEESENDGEYKRKAFGRRSPTPTGTYEEYRSPDSQLQDDTSHSYEPQQQHTRFGFANPDQHQHQEHAYASSDRGQYSDNPQHYLPAQQTHLDPLASVAELFPGTHPHVQQAQARLHAQHHSVGSESTWEDCTLEEWKEGGDELAKKFGALVARVVALVAKKSSRTDGFKQQMQEHRDELQQQETKLEGTKEGLSKWAAVVGLGGSA